MKSNIKQKSLQLVLYIFAILGGAAVIYGGLFSILSGRVMPTAFAQQDPFLAQRIDRIEQQFNSIETRINRLEQQGTRLPNITPGNTKTDNTELRLLRSEVEILRLRLSEAECGLSRLDERTLTSAARQARRKSTAG